MYEIYYNSLSITTTGTDLYFLIYEKAKKICS